MEKVHRYDIAFNLNIVPTYENISQRDEKDMSYQKIFFFRLQSAYQADVINRITSLRVTIGLRSQTKQKHYGHI